MLSYCLFIKNKDLTPLFSY